MIPGTGGTQDPNAINVQLESFFNDFDNTITRVLHFLQFPEAQIPAMARPRPQPQQTAWSIRLTRWME
jgi:hypothetical protein